MCLIFMDSRFRGNDRKGLYGEFLEVPISLGRLKLAKPFEQFIQEQLRENDIDLLPIDIRHLTKLIYLPFHHRDPFDRILIAQAMVEGLPVISTDTVFKDYGIEVIW